MLYCLVLIIDCGTKSTPAPAAVPDDTPLKDLITKSPTGTSHAHRKLFRENTLTEKETIAEQNLNANGIIRITTMVQLIHYCRQKKKKGDT
ncbi:hypothetical protein SORBI_3006G048600 [Sorghum bicolor]|uniref:Uncharacterized protein n=1 Tax=Sorghum bicolor TaxID=4558 RepID=A0A1B6PK85_SORBI|nr:hypothetical protein SORBI_3006G048600 [Sorghum bicolor]